MAVVVEPTLPFPSEALDLQNTTRWNKLMPLIRPSIKHIQTPDGLNLLIDTIQLENSPVMITAVVEPGNFASTLLDRGMASVICTHCPSSADFKEDEAAYSGIETALRQEGYSKPFLLVRVGKQTVARSDTENVSERHIQNTIELDHVLSVLKHAQPQTFEHADHLLAASAWGGKHNLISSRFHSKKMDGKPATTASEEAVSYDLAKHTVIRELKRAIEGCDSHPSKPEIVSVHYADINGLSRLENYIMAKEIAEFLGASKQPYLLSHSTVLDHKDTSRGFAISAWRILEKHITEQRTPKQHQATKRSAAETSESASAQRTTPSGLAFSDASVRKRIQAGCNAVIAAEPTITEYDTIVGDGDCGYTLRDGARHTLKWLEEERAGKDVSGDALAGAVGALVGKLEVTMGGTSGALYCIFLTALAGALGSEESMPAALQAALDQLQRYTRARAGDRTMMDALIPFVETWRSGGDLKAAVAAANEGVQRTADMQASLGRSAYLDDSATRGVPDPGAYGLFILLKGMVEG